MPLKLDKLIATSSHRLFIPFSFRLSLKLEQVEWSEFVDDPGLASFTLKSGQKLFQANGIVNWFDTWLEASAAGVQVERDAVGNVTGDPAIPTGIPEVEAFMASEPVAFVSDITRRLCREIGDRGAVVGGLTGGATILTRFFGAAKKDRLMAESDDLTAEEKELMGLASRLSVGLAKDYCEAGVSALALLEDTSISNFGYLGAFNALFNMAAYYEVPVILLSHQPIDRKLIPRAKHAGVTNVLLSTESSENLLTIPSDLFRGGAEEVSTWIRSNVPSGGSALYTSDWELPFDSRAETVLAARKELSRH